MEITVVIPVYNAARFLEEAVRSALDQPEVAEVVLVDDGSSDGSLELCRDWAAREQRVRVLTHPDAANRGPAATRNLGIRQASREFLAFLDADDYFLPNRFRVAREVFSEDPGVDAVYEAVRNFCETDQAEQIWQQSGEPELYTYAEQVDPEQLYETMLDGKRGYFCTDGLTLRRRLLDATGLFDEHMRWAEDTLLWLKMAAVGRLVGGSLLEPVAMRRVHGANTVLQNRERYVEHRLTMYHRLLRWGARGPLHHHRLILTLEKMLRQWAWEVPRHRGWSPARVRLEELFFLLRVGMRYRFAWQSELFRKSLSSRLGWQRLKRLLWGASPPAKEDSVDGSRNG